ncbi:glycoprotein [Pseudonocardia sulfidoxydans NBRC 16205]|uniref:Glycoprotein n=1 Tax=Pseudonocardia sulfidoxydans NBRC 16205 TaxID=1223511 RepID=A0A511DDV6_9PSEU|nr:DUF6049 family protein [Pseudonocardia sulfidoxydans]GEL22979.1 glycoprotein [Pseudonocardia sulfidoxydans NBRC 16205]
MRPVAALVAIALLFLAGPFAGSATAAPGDAPAASLQLALDQLTPRVVTSDGPSVVTVTGTVTNTGSVPVAGLAVRLQRGDPLHTDSDAAAALEGRAGTDAVSPSFVDVPGTLEPGASISVRIDAPLRATGGTGLGIDTPGTYPLLVNVNGEPDGQARARLAATRMLLPVLSLPAAVVDGALSEDVGGTVPGTARPFTMLYPIVDVPHRLPGVPGETTTLTDDELARSFAEGGRLNGLVGALAQRAPVGSTLRTGLCVAVDPDLLQTAQAMADGYQVRAPDGTVSPGTGADAARAWLAGVTAALRGSCVVALPFADADLVALTRNGDEDAAVRAVEAGREVAGDILDTPLQNSLLWPADGVIDDATLSALAGPERVGGLVLSSAAVTQAGRTGVVALDDGPGAALADDLLTSAATPADAPATAGGPVTSSPAAVSTPLSTQDLIGALAFRATSSPGQGPSSPVLLAPPHLWGAEGTGADALLSAISLMTDRGLLEPRALTTSGATTRPTSLLYPIGAGAAEVPASVVDRTRGLVGDIDAVATAAVADPGADVTPDDVFVPLRRAMLRPVSAAWRGRPVLATRAADLASTRLDELRATVRVLEPPGPYSLGTSDAPLLMTVSNGLPVALDVRIVIASTAGLQVAPIPDQRIPPLGRIQVRVSAQVVRAGQFAVDAIVQTPRGDDLGPPTRLQVRSTAYGTVTVWLTVIAGALLVLLVIRRIVRRARDRSGPPDGPADGPGDGPGPGPGGPPAPGERRPSPPEPAGTGPTVPIRTE